MKVLFILHEYFPTPSAITNCIEPIMQKMLKKGTQIDVLTRRSKQTVLKRENINDVNIYRINDYYSIINDKIEISKGFQKIIFKVLRKLFLYTKGSKLNNEIGLLNFKKAKKLGKYLINQKQYDIIISVSYPFTTHKIAQQLVKNKNISWIAYQCDPHSLNHTFNEETGRRMEEEINCLSEAEIVFLSKENYQQNVKTDLVTLKNKYHVIPFPIIKEQKMTKRLNKNEPLKFVYTGTLYNNLRDPYDMLDFFSKIDLDYILEIYYFAEEDVKKKLIDYESKFNGKLILFQNAPKEVCQTALERADIIINIGNNVANQLPSKIYESIQQGKPIVNFYKITDDSSKQVLKKYPLGISIKVPNSKKHRDFLDFCKNNLNKRLTYNQITKLYQSADSIAEEFYKKLEYIYENKKNHL